MNASAFDPSLFLQATTTEQGSTVSVPIPVSDGAGYLAVIAEVKARQWRSKDGQSSGLALDIVYNIDEPKVKEALGRDKVTITQGIMVDLTEQGGLDMSKGKNVSLNRVRDAVGQNVAGQPWAPAMLVGRPVRVVVGHRPSDRPQDPPGTVFADVNGVVKA
jgi:hypothetical protein